MFWCLLLLISLHAGQLIDQNAQSFRIIPIPSRDNAYSNFASIVFMSQGELDSFLALTATQIGWNNRQEFEDALRNAKLDFTKEALVFLRHSEGSGSVQVTFETPTLQDQTLLCEIRGRPIPSGTADMADYCFAVAVSKSQVSQVELQAIEGGFFERRLAPMLLPIIEKEPTSDYKQLQPLDKQNDVPECPTISVSCPDAGRRENEPIRFRADVTGGKPMSEFSYNWSVSKGRISCGQGTTAIEVEVTGMDLEGLTATVEVGGFEPNCPRVASCSMAISSPVSSVFDARR